MNDTKTSTQSGEKARKVNSSSDNNINSGLINSTTNKQINNKKDFIQNQITKDNRSVVTGEGTITLNRL